MENKKKEMEKNQEMDINNKELINLINPIFKDKTKKQEIIQKLYPFFSLKLNSQGEIDREYSAVEKIDPEKIEIIEEYQYEEKMYDSKNKFLTNCKSVGLSNFDQKEENFNQNFENSSKVYCIHSIVIKLFRIIFDFKEIKLAKQVIEELEKVKNANATEKKVLLEQLVDKFGLYIPLEFFVGGRINYSFEANNEEEAQAVHSLLQREIKAKFGEGYKEISASLEGNSKNKNTFDNSSITLNNVKNLSIQIEGGDYAYKDDFKKWVQSLNIDNLQIIEYKTLSRIYSFIPELESNLIANI